uniref:uncharacterized protein LOC118143102 isoform X1 n=1 Tax=Callithrix jacchus TaxID=9483 RepID=UPI00159F6F79|nr:uncharacterized protein LOC118143102 isoform X1 [Callithrix jacchus]
MHTRTCMHAFYQECWEITSHTHAHAYCMHAFCHECWEITSHTHAHVYMYARLLSRMLGNHITHTCTRVPVCTPSITNAGKSHHTHMHMRTVCTPSITNAGKSHHTHMHTRTCMHAFYHECWEITSHTHAHAYCMHAFYHECWEITSHTHAHAYMYAHLLSGMLGNHITHTCTRVHVCTPSITNAGKSHHTHMHTRTCMHAFYQECWEITSHTHAHAYLYARLLSRMLGNHITHTCTPWKPGLGQPVGCGRPLAVWRGAKPGESVSDPAPEALAPGFHLSSHSPADFSEMTSFLVILLPEG